METNYKVNNIFNESGVTFNELMSSFVVSFLDKELNIYGNDIVSNL